MKKLLSWITGAPVEVIGEYFTEKQRLKYEVKLERMRGKRAWEEAKTRRAEASEGRDHDWETLSIKNSGWKDEATWVVLSIPMVCVFIPPLQPYIAQGFIHLETTPDWYTWMVVMIYCATFGIRVWRRKIG
jgi:hypothetical protein